MVVGLGSTRKRSGKSTKLLEFAKYIPLRLSADERALLTVLQQTLHVSEYTDHVDVTSARRGNKTRRILDGILEVCHIATGLAVASGKERALMSSCGDEHPPTSTAAATATKAQDEEDDLKSAPLRKLSFRLTPRKSNKSDKKKSAKGSSKHSTKSVESETDTTTSSTTTEGQSPSSSWVARDPKDNAALFQAMFEISRRNKVLNPTSMRTTYGKLMYMLQDAQNPTVAKSLGFSVYKPLILVAPYLEQHGAGALLKDERLEGATQYITDRNPRTGKPLDRQLVQEMVNNKRQLEDELVQEYASNKISAENVRRCIESIADAISYVESNAAPVQQMIHYLEEYFDPDKIEGRFSLEISSRLKPSYAYNGASYAQYGLSALSSPDRSSGGSKLSHSHSTQYTFVWQSLQLWCKVMRNMHKLWVCADEDLLSTTSTYHLHNTGQGLNRVQNCPRVRKVMQGLLQQTQEEAGQPWVGLSVIHLGDRDVPNALIFIDKYTQIPRFLNPIVSFLQALPALCQDKRIAEYVTKTFGSQRKLTMTVLADYFKHGFDGSGDDGGSCIDGRLTSSWNFTSRISKKPYYHVFMMSGFQGFDGEFK